MLECNWIFWSFIRGNYAVYIPHNEHVFWRREEGRVVSDFDSYIGNFTKMGENFCLENEDSEIKECIKQLRKLI